MSHLEANLILLSKRQPKLAQLLRETEIRCVKVFDSVRGGPTAIYRKGTNELSLHSRYEPLKEARQTVQKADIEGADYIVLLGFGLGYLMDALLENNANLSRHFFIVESDLDILKSAFEARDMSRILSQPYLHFAWPVEGTDLAEQWSHFFDPVQARKNTYIAHLPSVSLNPAIYKTASEIIQSQIYQIFTDINTLVEKSRIFLSNFVENIRRAALAPGVIKFSGKFPDVPAVIVSAGPSLDKNVHELRGYKDRVLILSTDTALKPLLGAGIEPHFVLTGDPYQMNYRHLEGASIGNSLIVAEATSYPDVFSEFEDRIVVCSFDNSSLRSLADLSGNKGMLRAWGSVATMALDFALLLKCNPVIFIGQDLAHSDGRIYCSGVYFEEDWFQGVHDPESWNQRLIELRNSRQTLKTEDIFGRVVESTDKLTAYWNWMLKEIQNNPGVRFINATEGGILRGGLEIASLKESLYRHCTQTLQLGERIENIFRESRSDSLHYSNLDLSTLEAETASIENILKQGSRLCRSKTELRAQDLLKRLEDIKERIYFNTHVAPLLDCLNQMGNVDFLRRRKLFRSIPPESDCIPEMQSTYYEYFKTVHDALTITKRALKQIRKNLKLP